MSIGIRLEELLDYSDHERAKWRAWVVANPARLQIAFQSSGRFPTVGALLDHLFLVERRHLSRLQGSAPHDTTGVAASDWQALFEYGDLVRADFRHYLSDVSDDEARESLTFTVPSGEATMTRRKLATTIVLHEIRHLAQIAFAVRRSGEEPPGQHDLFYFTEFP